MADGRQTYMHQIYNKSGYVLLYPGVGSQGALLEDVPPNPYAASVSQLYPLGTKLISGIEGWWYCYNGAVELALGAPTQSAAAVHAEHDDNIAVGVAADIGDYEVSITSTTNLAAAPYSTKNGAAEGYLFVNDAAGEGQCYKIKSHALLTGTSQAIVTLYDPLTVALTTSSEVGIIQHPCANVIASAAVVTGIFAGIPPLTVAINYYFWNKMAGPAACAVTSLIPKGTKVVIGTTAAQATAAAAATTEIVIGYPLTPANTTDDEYFMVMLTGNW